jgi:predicted DNA binding protein
MFEAKFKLKHIGCWTQGLKIFRSDFITHNTLSLTEDFVQDITEVSATNSAEKEKIKKYFENCRLIKKAEMLQETDKKLLIQIFTDTSKIKSVVHIVLKNKCFPSKKVPLVDGWEVWTIASTRKSYLKKAIDEIQRLGEFRLLYIKKSTFDGFNLSPSQEKILKIAISHGYYNWPKKTSIKRIARQLNLSSATVAEHLRKAEIKIINREFGK